jgi:methylglutaconyl-CoA hydratase
MSSELITDLDAMGVLRLTMNRPEVHNAFDDHQVARLTAAFEAAGHNQQVRVVVLAATGNSFSAGGDINYMRRMGANSYEENLADGGQLAFMLKTLNTLPKPTIARVQGAFMGGGVGLVSCCDYAIGSSRARFALSEVKLGLAPATIAPYVVNVIGEKVARQLFMSGLPVNAQRALQLGMLYALAEDDQLDSAIDQLAATLLQNSPDGIRAAKALAMDVSRGAITDSMIESTVTLLADLRDSEQGKEGLSAFLDKRKPSWI